MPDVNLILKADLGPINNAFATGDALIDQTNTSVKTFEKDSKKAYTSATTEASKFSAEVKKGTKEVSDLGKSTEAVGKSANRLRELKQEIKNLTGEAIKLKQQGDILGSNEAIKNAGKLKDELKDIQDAIVAVSGNAKENFAKAIGGATSLATQGFEAATAASSLFGDKNEEVEKQLLKLQAIASLSRLAAEFGDIGDRIKEVKLGLAPLTSGLKTFYTAGNEGLKNLAKNGIGSFSGLLAGAKGFFSNFGAGLKSLVQSGIQGIKALGAAAAANPFGIILISVVALIGIMVALRDKVKPIAAIFKALGEFVDAVGDALQALGEALDIVADAQERARDAIIKGNEDAVKAIERRYAREIKLAASAGKDTKNIEAAKLQEVYNTNQKTIEALIAKNKTIENFSKEELAQFRELNEKQRDIVTDVQALANEKRKEEADKQKEADKKAIDAAKAQADKLKQLRKELADFLLDLAKRANAAEIELLTGEDKINAQRKAAQAEIDLLKETLLKKKIAAKQGNDITQVEANEFRKLELLADQQQADALIKLEVEKSNKIIEARKKETDNEIKFLDTKTKLAIAQVEGIKNTTGLSEIEFEKVKQKQILEIQLKANNDIFDAKRQQLDNDLTLTKDQLELEKQLLITETINTSNEIQKKIDDLNKNQNKFSLAKLFGFSDEEFGKIKQGLGQLSSELQGAVSAFFDYQNSLLDIELKANEKKKELSDQRISDRENELKVLQDGLEKEQGLRAEGLANNVDLIQQQIDAKQNQIEQEKIQQDDALKQEAAIRAQKQQLAKQQAIADSVIQGSNLITSATNIYASLSPLGPPGIAIAIATITAMLSAFALAKAQIFNSLKTAEFKEGGYTGGNSPNEERGTVHGLEFVHTADKTKRYRNLFEGIHKDDKLLIHKGILELIDGKGISLEPNLPQKISNQKSNIQVLSNSNFKNNNKEIEKQMLFLNNQVIELSKKLDNKITILPNGTRIEKRGTITRTIKGKNE